jgi:RNA polymerase sigma factor (sigma-70 family)
MRKDAEIVTSKEAGTPFLMELLPALRLGNEAAQRRVVDRLYHPLVRSLCRKGFREDVAHDATVDAFFKIFSKLMEQTTEEGAKSRPVYATYFHRWAFGFAYKIRQKEQERKKKERSLDQPHNIDGDEAIDEALEREGDRRNDRAREAALAERRRMALYAALPELDELERNVIKSRYPEKGKVTPREKVALALDLSVAKIKRIEKKAIAKLRTTMARMLDDSRLSGG